jgi:hypothetical protein
MLNARDGVGSSGGLSSCTIGYKDVPKDKSAIISVQLNDSVVLGGARFIHPAFSYKADDNRRAREPRAGDKEDAAIENRVGPQECRTERIHRFASSRAREQKTGRSTRGIFAHQLVKERGPSDVR